MSESAPGVQQVMQFRATCNACRKTFPNPLLSDFAYGEFLLRGERGTAFAFLDAIKEPAWEVLAALTPPVPRDVVGPEVARFHRIVLACVDPIDGQRPTMDGPICPHCQSHDVRYGAGYPMGPRAIPHASFDGFMSLSPDERARKVAKLLELDPL